MNKKIALIKGDGIGPEIVDQAIKVLNAISFRFNHKFEFSEVDMGACAIDKHGVPINDSDLKICAESDAVLLGAIGDPKYDNNPSAKVRPEQGLLKLRQSLGLFSNIRPIKTYTEIEAFSPLKSELLQDVDFVIYRELIGGIYFGEKKLSANGKVASDLCSYSTKQIGNITHQAFQAAMQRSKRLTLVDKANVLETSRLWRKEVMRIAKEYPEVELDFLFVDNAAMQIIQNPSSFDIILTENMFGDILSDLASVTTGSIGLLPSASLGGVNGLFEPIHGSYPQAKGLDIANPNATILAVAMMLDYFELYEEAETVRKAVLWALESGLVTQDLNKEDFQTCSAMGDLIAEHIEHEGELVVNKEVTEKVKGVFI
jgi:3-isopropylmalate dehydrogenase